MPAWIAPLAVNAARVALIAGVAYAIGRRHAAPRPELQERALDDLPDTLEIDAGRENTGLRADLAARGRRVVRVSYQGRAGHF
jgi:hypothetical protein